MSAINDLPWEDFDGNFEGEEPLLVEREAEVLDLSERGIRVRGAKIGECWVPRSHVVSWGGIEPHAAKVGDTGQLWVSHWLGSQRGWVRA